MYSASRSAKRSSCLVKATYMYVRMHVASTKQRVVFKNKNDSDACVRTCVTRI